MLEPGSSGAPMFPRARMRATEALFRERAAEIVAAVVRQAEAGDRAAMRLARKHGLPVGPTPEVLAARLAESIERTRATVATLLARQDSRVGNALCSGPPGRRAGCRHFRRENETSGRHAVLQRNRNGGDACK
jgi:hypothetical protein